ncbi:MAG: hypothetical protein U0167_18685 [bacterium]
MHRRDVAACLRAAISAKAAVAAAACLVLVPLALPSRASDRPAVVVVPDTERPALSAEIREQMAAYDSVTKFPLPALEDDRLKELLDGEVVRFQEKWKLPDSGDEEQARHRVIAFRLVRAPRGVVWVSALDPHFSLNDRITEVPLSEDSSGGSRWYQFMDLPWPVRNRHWVIRLEKGVEVATRTSGRVWEQSWHLVPDGKAIAEALADSGKTGDVSPDHVRGARYLEANDGAWALFALRDDLTLIAYNLTITLGGWIPEGMAARFAMSALEDMMDRIAVNTERVPTHYVEGHETIYAGDGSPIPPGTPPAASP